VNDPDPKLDKGIPQDQLEEESVRSIQIQDKRTSAGDAHMKLQVQRAGMQGDIESMTEQERQSLFNPDGTLPHHEVMDRIQRYQAEHSKIAFAPGEERKTVRTMGKDPSTGNYRFPNPGEAVQGGDIVMVNPQYAEEMAYKMKNAQENDVKNSMRRSKALNDLVLQLSTRVEPTNATFVTFEQAREMTAQFDAEKAEGWPSWKHDFLPLREYINQFAPRQRRDGSFTKPYRAILENEHGTLQMGTNPSSKLKGVIVCVRDKDMTQNLNIQTTVPTSNQEWLQKGATQAPTERPNPPQPTVQPGPQNPVAAPSEGLDSLLKGLPPKPEGF